MQIPPSVANMARSTRMTCSEGRAGSVLLGARDLYSQGKGVSEGEDIVESYMQHIDATTEILQVNAS